LGVSPKTDPHLTAFFPTKRKLSYERKKEREGKEKKQINKTKQDR
jgi:hypothetical protein